MINRILLVAFLFCFVAPVNSQQVMEEDWVAWYSGPGYASDQICAMDIDRNGFTYVTGFVRDADKTDFMTIKYTNQGDTVWTRQYNAEDLDVPHDLAVDRDGNVYVVGLSVSGNYRHGKLLKYNADGVLQWAKTQPFVHYPSLALDHNDNLFVAGPVYAFNDSSHMDCMTQKYYPNGNTAWTRRHHSGLTSYFVNDIAADGNGDVVIVGYRVNDAKSYDDMDGVTLKYTGEGVLAWERAYDDDHTAVCMINAVAVDTDNNVCIAGYTQHVSANGLKDNTDIITIKYDSDGDTSWIQQYNSPGDSTDIAEDIAVDASGNVLVAGHTMNLNADEFEYHLDYITIKYLAGGKESWGKTYNAKPGCQDQATAVAVDSLGAVYCTGFGVANDTSTVTTLKYNPDGSEAWVMSTEGSDYNPAKAVAIAVRATDNVVVAGYGYGKETGRDFVTIQYVPASPRPIITLDRDKFDYIGLIGEMMSITDSFSITNAGDGRLVWSISHEYDWFTVTPESGTAPSTVILYIDVASLPSGLYRDTIIVTSRNAVNSPQYIPIVLNLKDVNHAPEFTTIFRDTTLTEDESYGLEIRAVDTDLDSLILTCLNLPEHANFVDSGNGAGALALPTSYDDVGQSYVMVFEVSDRLASSADTLQVDIINRPLVVVEPQPGPGEQYDDIFIDALPLEIQFNEAVDAASLDGNITIASARGDELQYQYHAALQQVEVTGSGPYLRELDTITISLAADILDLAGYPLGEAYERTLITGLAVYPGDTDDDGVVDERDILPLGRFWKQTGPPRAETAEIEWGLKPAHRWENTVATYADADGSGTVDADDICAIAENWLMNQDYMFPPTYDPDTLAGLDKVMDGMVRELIAESLSGCRECAGKQALLDLLGEPGTPPDILLPINPELYQNYPNPFNPSTTVRFYLPQAELVSLAIYNITGQKVVTLLAGQVESGYTAVTWDGLDFAGHPVASGVYFYRLETKTTALSRSMLLLK